MNTPLTSAIVVALFAMLVVCVPASGMIYVGTVTEESHVDLSNPNDGLYSYTNEISVAAPLDDFNFAFSALGDTNFTITWQAPVGYRIRITPPSGFDGTQVIFQFITGNSGYNVGAVQPAASLSLSGLSGNTLPTMTTSTQFTGPKTATLPANNAGAFVFASNYAFDEPFYVTSATVNFTVPAAYDVDFNAPLDDFKVYGAAFSNNPASPPADPEQWITLVPIPEPATLPLLACAALALFKRNRRSESRA